jgi:hypothetical protein
MELHLQLAKHAEGHLFQEMVGSACQEVHSLTTDPIKMRDIFPFHIQQLNIIIQ